MSTNPSVKAAFSPLWLTNQLTLSIPEITLVLFAFFLSLYLLFLPDIAYQPWDSLDYAYSIETIGIITMRGNHPLGHFIHSIAYSLARGLGFDVSALWIAQGINSFAGSLTVALFFLMLAHQLKIKRLTAFGYSILLGASFGFWFYTGTADIYVVSLLFILLTWVFLIHEVILRNRPLPIVSGIFAGLAIVSHQLNILLIPIGLFLMLLSSGKLVGLEGKAKQILTFLFLAIATSAPGYGVLGFIATSSYSPSWIIGWARGHFGDPTYGRYLSLQHFFTAFDTAFKTIIANPHEDNNFFHYLFLFIILLVMLSGLIFNKALDDKRRAVWMIATLQCLITWTLILWWEPQNVKFWILTLVPWILSLALASEAIDSRLQSGRFRSQPKLNLISWTFPVLMGFLILATNFPVISEQHNPESERTIAFHRAVDLWMQHSNPDSVIISAGDLIPHLLYWGERPGTVILYRSLQLSQSSPDDFYELHTRISLALCEHRTVLFTSEAAETLTDHELSLVEVSREDLRAFFADNIQKGKIVFWYENSLNGKLVPVYALTDTGDCVN